MRVVVFGDSIAYGAWDSEGGWVDRLKRDAHNTTVMSEGKDKIQIINLGIGGNTSAGLLGRLEAEIQARRSASWPFVFIVAIGANDGRTTDRQTEVPLSMFQANLERIAEIAKQYSDKIFLLGLPPIGAAEVHLKKHVYSDTTIKQYDDTIKNVADANDLQYIPIRPLFEASDADDLYFRDRLHPNDAGHLIIAQAVLPYLQGLGLKL